MYSVTDRIVLGQGTYCQKDPLFGGKSKSPVAAQLDVFLDESLDKVSWRSVGLHNVRHVSLASKLKSPNLRTDGHSAGGACRSSSIVPYSRCIWDRKDWIHLHLRSVFSLRWFLSQVPNQLSKLLLPVLLYDSNQVLCSAPSMALDKLFEGIFSGGSQRSPCLLGGKVTMLRLVTCRLSWQKAK